eukprot:jgi/Bigna1/87357/estExt_fgenesh1_pg.C_190148
MGKSGGESVRVFVRCRPFNKLEKSKKCERVVFMNKEVNQCSIKVPGEPNKEPKTFTFDGVYNPSSQLEVYEETSHDLVNNVIDGFNGTIFAYGQTGCGKTYSMMGLDSPDEERGIIPKSFHHIFDTINANTEKNKKYLVRGAFIEIYNEEVRDLLAADYKQALPVKEHPEKGVFVQGLTHTVVKSSAELITIMDKGNGNRTVGATRMNAGSSRSHSIFVINIETVTHDEETNDDRFTAGKLNLVDLAGSERQSKTGAEGMRLTEAKNINLSLSALGNVISALTSKKAKHIPYRDSKLTRLLQDSLGGNTKTVMIAAVSPADYNYDETLSTLRYANRAKAIKNKPVKNEDPKDALLREYQEEIKRLKAMLTAQANGLPMPIPAPAESKSNQAEASTNQKKLKVESGGQVRVVEDQADIGKMKAELSKMQEESKRKTEELMTRLREEKQRIAKLQQDREQLLQEKTALKQKVLNEAAEWKASRRRSEGKDTTSSSQRLKLTPHEDGVGHRENSKLSRNTSHLPQKLDSTSNLAGNANKANESCSYGDDEYEKSAEIIQQTNMMDKEEKAIERQIADRRNLAQQIAEQVKQDTRDLKEHDDELKRLIQKERESAANQKADFEKQLAILQEKLLEGGEINTSDAEGKRRIDDARRKALKEKQEKLELERKQKKLQEEKVFLEDKYADIQEEIQGKTKKLKKLRTMYKLAKKEIAGSKQEIKDLQDEFENEREGYLSNIREIYREMSLHKQLLRKVVPDKFVDKIVKTSKWDDEEDCWKLPEIEFQTAFPKLRSNSRSRDQSRGRDDVSQGRHWSANYERSSISLGARPSGSASRSSYKSKKRSYYTGDVSFEQQIAHKAPARLKSLGGGANGPSFRSPVGSVGFEGGGAGGGGEVHRVPRKGRSPVRKRQEDRFLLAKRDKTPLKSSLPRRADRGNSITLMGSIGRSKSNSVIDQLNDAPVRKKFEPAPVPVISTSAKEVDLSALLGNAPKPKPKFEPARDRMSFAGSEHGTRQSIIKDAPTITRPRFQPAKIEHQDNHNPLFDFPATRRPQFRA